MRVITANNVNDALTSGFYWLKATGQIEKSRGGDVMVARGPVATRYFCPKERVLFNPTRDANPVFHLMEAIWMLSGQRNVEWLLQFNSTFDRFAEDDKEMHGAYGYRWRKHFPQDQIFAVIHELRRLPNSRRAVIAMWDPDADLRVDKKDIPCNTHIYFGIRDGHLDMSVCCRSNDILWGAYGANAVHMSILQEVIAYGVGVPVGSYVQFSNNFHAYLDAPNVRQYLQEPPETVDYYERREVEPMPLLRGSETVDQLLADCEDMCLGGFATRTRFLQRVAEPLREAYIARKTTPDYLFRGDLFIDWFRAFSEWNERRYDACK